MMFIKQEEEARKRKELEDIMAENNKKIEEAQQKLVSAKFNMYILYYLLLTYVS